MLSELKEGARRNPIWFGAIAAITGVQGFFAWEFWSLVSTEPAHQAALRVLGLSFVAGEVVALDMASRAELGGEPRRAASLRALWAALAVTTFTADINALSNVLREGDAPRVAAAAAFDANQSRITELEDAIARADDPFGHDLMSVVAYDAAIAGKRRELETARGAHARMWRILQLESQLTELEAERAAAAEAAAYQAELGALRRDPATHAPRPQTGAVEFEPAAQMFTGAARQAQEMFGQRPDAAVSAEDVRTGMVWVATVAMKLMLTFGVWVGLQRGRGTGSAPQAPSSTKIPEPGQGPAPSRPTPRTRSTSNAATFSRRGQRFSR